MKDFCIVLILILVSVRGDFQIRPVDAYLIHDTEFILDMDPYLLISMGATEFRTTVHRDGGRHQVGKINFVLEVKKIPFFC